MKENILYPVLVVLTLLSSCSSDGEEINNIEPILLTPTEIEDLKILREEEKLARDVYVYAFNKYGDPIFSNISNSEQQHMDRILVLLNKYNLDDPALAYDGAFTNQELQGLYNSLIEQVDISLVEALKVGATIEDLDIKDIDDFERRTDKADILNVYNKLKCGSRNHMRSYYGQLENEGVTYEPQFISETELTAIINGSKEQCGN